MQKVDYDNMNVYVQYTLTSLRIEKWISWVAKANMIKSASCCCHKQKYHKTLYIRA